jgi:hypothetical protein
VGSANTPRSSFRGRCGAMPAIQERPVRSVAHVASRRFPVDGSSGALKAPATGVSSLRDDANASNACTEIAMLLRHAHACLNLPVQCPINRLRHTVYTAPHHELSFVLRTFLKFVTSPSLWKRLRAARRS